MVRRLDMSYTELHYNYLSAEEYILCLNLFNGLKYIEDEYAHDIQVTVDRDRGLFDEIGALMYATSLTGNLMHIIQTTFVDDKGVLRKSNLMKGLRDLLIHSIYDYEELCSLLDKKKIKDCPLYTTNKLIQSGKLSDVLSFLEDCRRLYGELLHNNKFNAISTIPYGSGYSHSLVRIDGEGAVSESSYVDSTILP